MFFSAFGSPVDHEQGNKMLMKANKPESIFDTEKMCILDCLKRLNERAKFRKPRYLSAHYVHPMDMKVKSSMEGRPTWR